MAVLGKGDVSNMEQLVVAHSWPPNLRGEESLAKNCYGIFSSPIGPRPPKRRRCQDGLLTRPEDLKLLQALCGGHEAGTWLSPHSERGLWGAREVATATPIRIEGQKVPGRSEKIFAAWPPSAAHALP